MCILFFSTKIPVSTATLALAVDVVLAVAGIRQYTGNWPCTQIRHF